MTIKGREEKREAIFRVSPLGQIQLFLLEPTPITPAQWHEMECYVVGSVACDEMDLLDEWRT
jgi:hypothetical protein